MVALRRKLSDITNDDNETRTPHKSKRQRIRSPSASSEDEGEGSRADDTYVYHAGHKFFLIHGPWIRLADDLFGTKFDEAYNAVERFENDENKAQGQLQEVWSLLCGKFERVALQQKWVHRAVRDLFNKRYVWVTEMHTVYERIQDRTLQHGFAHPQPLRIHLPSS